MRALVAGLVAAAAAFIVVALATADDDDGGGGAKAPAAGRPASGAALFANMGCGSCHTLAAASATGTFGPSLDERLPDHTRASLRAMILKPPPNSMMPANFGSRMKPAEIDALVTYLLRSSRLHEVNNTPGVRAYTRPR